MRLSVSGSIYADIRLSRYLHIACERAGQSKIPETIAASHLVRFVRFPLLFPWTGALRFQLEQNVGKGLFSGIER